MKTYAKIRFYWGAFVISTIVAVLMIPFITIFPKHKGVIIHKLNKLILILMGSKVKAVGKRDKDANFFLINHQGIMDIVALEALENTHFRWVAKKELFNAPWFGYLLKNGDMIEVDRDSKAGLIKLLKDTKESITKKGRSVAIFPEGTRAKGQELLDFKAGAKLVANKLKLRVQPIVVTGSKHVLNEHVKTGHNGTIYIHYLDAFDIEDANKDWFEQLKETMQEVIDNEEKQGIER